MDNPRPEKVAVVDEVRGRLDAAQAVILTEYRGLKVKDLAGLRRTVRTSGGEYKIYKNTLVRLAVQDSGLDGLHDLLVGPTGITFVEGDAAAVAKVLRDYSRTNPLLVLKGGVLGGRVIGVSETAALADLPSREALLGRLAGGFAAPLQQLASLLQASLRDIAYGLVALRDQRAEGEPAPAPAEAPAEAAAEAPAAEAPEAEAADVESPAPADAPAAEAPVEAADVESPAPADAPAAEAPVEAAAEARAEAADTAPATEEPEETEEAAPPAASAEQAEPPTE